MAACSVARIMSLGHLALTVLPKLLALSPGAHRKFRKDPQLTVMETQTAVQISPELPVDVLLNIFALLEIPDLIRAGSVCSAWGSAYTILYSHPDLYKRPQTPCLLYTSHSLDAADNVASLYSLAEKKVYNITLPDPPIRNRHLIGSSHGWLVTADDKSELHLLNPITGQQIALPSVITIEHVEPILDNAGAVIQYELWDDSDVEIHDLDKLRDCLYFKAFVFPDPSSGSHIVVLILLPYRQLSFTRVGDCKWTVLPSGSNYDQCIYMDGLLYAFTRTGGVDAFDLTGPTFTRNIIADEMVENDISGTDGFWYTVQTPCADLLRVCREIEITDEFFIETEKIVVFKADMEAKKLVKMNALRGHVLFLGRSQSQCLSTEEYPQLKPNCVYFTDDETFISKSKNNRRDIGVLNLENDSREEIIPQLWCNWPNPIWITLSITRMNMELYI